MIALVTTSLAFLAVDLETGEALPLHVGKGLYFGISYSDDMIFVAARNNRNPFNYLDNRELEHENGSVLVFNYDLKFIGEIVMQSLATVPTLRDLHQLIFFDGNLWVVCAHDNLVCRYDSKTWHYWFPAPDPKDRWKDIHHFNSLWLDFDFKSMYTLAHKRSLSEIWKFSYPELELQETYDLGEHAHSVWKVYDDIYTCDSKGESVVSLNGFKLDVGGFTRGVVISEEFFIVGSSDIAERNEREHSSGKINVYDSEWNKLRAFNIEKLGQLNDIRMPGHYDVCHHWLKGEVPNFNREATNKIQLIRGE
jgi:hypothetical protein